MSAKYLSRIIPTISNRTYFMFSFKAIDDTVYSSQGHGEFMRMYEVKWCH